MGPDAKGRPRGGLLGVIPWLPLPVSLPHVRSPGLGVFLCLPDPPASSWRNRRWLYWFSGAFQVTLLECDICRFSKGFLKMLFFNS